MSDIPSALHIKSLICDLASGISLITDQAVEAPPRQIKENFVFSAPMVAFTRSEYPGAVEGSIPFSGPQVYSSATGISLPVNLVSELIPTGIPS